MITSQQEEITLISDPANVARIESFVEQIAAKYKIRPNLYGNILISLTEAVTNAITHGNCNDSTKIVAVRLEYRPKGFSFTVSDQGEGFDFENLPDPTSPENLLKLGGRGVFLMRQLADEIRYLDEGRSVEMLFRA
ncbi:MAG: ATP-binding protein [Saprospiraceae bacterium]|nr:ATP-binding protein [Saprospiraceae bacterium]